MNFINSESGNTFADLRVNTRLEYLFDKKGYNLSNSQFLEKLKCFGTTIDSVSKFSHKGLYYNNPLIFAINNKNLNLVKFLLENGSASRGYQQYPGYPLQVAISNINEEFRNKSEERISDLICIIEFLVNYGARFDDYLVHIFWYNYDIMYDSLKDDHKINIKKLYQKSPFNYNKYVAYLDMYCQNFISDQKEKMLNQFLKKHPIKRNRSFILVNFFSFK
jgi:hypothetical protein